MATLTFKGGVHPYDGKELSKDKAIVPYQPKGDLIYPVSQHIGAPAAPVVAKGDRVLVGQKIAEAGGFVSSPVYASVSGTVKAIEPHFVSTGAKVNSIVVENDGLYEEAPPVFQPDHLRGMREAFHAARLGYEKAGQAGGMGMQDAYQERGQLQYRADPGAAAGKAGGGGHGAAEI